jgi:hypothetical protein
MVAEGDRNMQLWLINSHKCVCWFFFIKPLKQLFISRGTPAYKNKTKKYKETLVSALRLLQYCQLPDKNCRDISRYIYNVFAVFQNSYVFIPLLLSGPLTVFCGNQRFRGTLFQKQWTR